MGVLLQLDTNMWKEIAQNEDLNIEKEEDLFNALVTYAEQYPSKQKNQILEAYGSSCSI
jgi:hypothetical protein